MCVFLFLPNEIGEAAARWTPDQDLGFVAVASTDLFGLGCLAFALLFCKYNRWLLVFVENIAGIHIFHMAGF